MGTGTLLQAKFIGIRTLYQQYNSQEGVLANAPTIHESMTTTQLWARIPIYNKVELFAQVPYQQLYRQLSSGTDQRNGLGDISVLVLYRLYKTKNDTLNSQHRLQGGLGVKAPTGAYDVAIAGTMNPGFQLGTGSWDYISSLEYTFGYKQSGVMLLANYVYKTENSRGYRFGNQFSTAGTFYHLFRNGRNKWVPLLGATGEWFATNTMLGYAIDQTAGHVLYAKYGLEWSHGKWGAGFTGFSPLEQQLAGGEVKVVWRGMLHLNFSL
jgi:hypothetical protein